MWQVPIIYYPNLACAHRGVPDSGFVVIPITNMFNQSSAMCYEKKQLYLSVDCSVEPNRKSGMQINFHQKEFSLNETGNCSATAGSTPLGDSIMDNTNSSSVFLPEEEEKNGLSSATIYKQELSSRVHERIIKEKKSEFTASAQDRSGMLYHYDDQKVSQFNHSTTGHLDESNYWPNNGKRIPWTVSDEIGQPDKEIIHDAVQAIQTQTFHCITFTQRTLEHDFISFELGRRCESHVGRQGGRQKVTLTPACMVRGVLMHLIMHSLGFFHEHHRTDRDQFLNIYKNHTAMDVPEDTFRVLSAMPLHGTEYDLDSILHYGAYDLSNQTDADYPVFVPKTRKKVKMGQRQLLSDKDIVKLHTAYNCTVDEKERFMGIMPEFTMANKTADQCSRLSRLGCSENPVTETCMNDRRFAVLCSHNTSTRQIKDLVTLTTEKPLRAVTLALGYNLVYPKPYLFWPVSKQVIQFVMEECTWHANATRIFPALRFANLLHLGVKHCFCLVLQRSDFAGWKKLVMVEFVGGTIWSMEPGTFTNLPALKILNVEKEPLGVLQRQQYPYLVRQHFREFVYRIHCACEFAHFRAWRKSNKNLQSTGRPGEIYHVQGIIVNRDITPETYQMYIPVNCSMLHFLQIPDRVNFSQTVFGE
ncbi:uncharacterized protein LOC129598864 [Paramacrobiotus metropolitanus]|uniref:uncharacterized protein LOC129598864 n=1 Tax=Paramacrobiotus metropolitanus TaxID=2943436 RepID=UPI00244594BE|nr:uncharacterized protein LOC129598864 [Paramacrobiotus metropolitanus]XP_055352926.1 uncharacterized protein LOC129598864 [Paramacrobiotus metropolitanus]XP_055352927.1 uncharacterized protein LOC129598864 [Paramacrobiotus metropolitanus]